MDTSFNPSTTIYPPKRLLRRLLWIYVVLLVLAGMGYARWDAYQLDGDAVAFMDISDAMLHHNWSAVPNGYWNPAYPAVLALGTAIAHPSRASELQIFYWCNFAIYLAAMFACFYLVTGLLRLRHALAMESGSALGAAGLLFFALSTLFISFMRELSLGKVRSDALLLTFIFLAAGTLLRLQAEKRFYLYPLLGFWLGLAYLTKSYAMLPSVALLLGMVAYALFGKSALRKQILAGAALTAIIFGCIAAPFVIAISHQRGRLTTGESARINYAFFVDETQRWHEWRTGLLGHATAQWKHHETLLDSALPAGPFVYSYKQHALGTYPLWFDPSYWTDGLKPKIYIGGHIKRLERTMALLTRFLLERPETLLLLLLLLAIGARFPRTRSQTVPFLACLGWGALMIAIYMPIDLQDRYTSFPYMLVLFPAAAMLRSRSREFLTSAATVATMVLAFALAGQGIRDIAQTRRLDNVKRIPQGAYSAEIYPLATELAAMGVHPGAIACMGDEACYVDHYWARLAETQITTEIEVPNEGDPRVFWQRLSNKDAVVKTVAGEGAQAIVAKFFPGDMTPEGWHQVPGTEFYIYPLR
jgi:hypothetical protein